MSHTQINKLLCNWGCYKLCGIKSHGSWWNINRQYKTSSLVHALRASILFRQADTLRARFDLGPTPFPGSQTSWATKSYSKWPLLESENTQLKTTDIFLKCIKDALGVRIEKMAGAGAGAAYVRDVSNKLTQAVMEIVNSSHFDKKEILQRPLNLTQAYSLLWQESKNGKVDGSLELRAGAVCAAVVDLIVLEKIEIGIDPKSVLGIKYENTLLKVKLC